MSIQCLQLCLRSHPFELAEAVPLDPENAKAGILLKILDFSNALRLRKKRTASCAISLSRFYTVTAMIELTNGWAMCAQDSRVPCSVDTACRSELVMSIGRYHGTSS